MLNPVALPLTIWKLAEAVNTPPEVSLRFLLSGRSKNNVAPAVSETTSLVLGVEEPIPTLPFASTVNSVDVANAAVEEDTWKSVAV